MLKPDTALFAFGCSVFSPSISQRYCCGVSIVQSQFQLDPFQKMLFLFCRRRQDRIKGLYWEGDGFLLLYKRLER